MAEELVNITEITDSLNRTLLNSIEPLISIFKIVGIALLVYIVFLLLKAIFRWRTMYKIVKIAKNLEEINKKMDVLIENTNSKKNLKRQKIRVKK